MSQTANTAIAVIGIDIGKNSFHVVGHDARGAIVLRQKWSRGQVEARLANIPPCLIGMEACVGAHHVLAPKNISLPRLVETALLIPTERSLIFYLRSAHRRTSALQQSQRVAVDYRCLTDQLVGEQGRTNTYGNVAGPGKHDDCLTRSTNPFARFLLTRMAQPLMSSHQNNETHQRRKTNKH